MKYLLFILLQITSCKAATPEYNPETIYLIVQSPKYKIRHRVFKNVEYNAFYEALYNDSLIYVRQDPEF